MRGDRQAKSKALRQPRLRRRLGRTLSRSRWREYDKLLSIARGQEYDLIGVESWLAELVAPSEGPVIVLRHDVDQHPGSALHMAAIEADSDVRSTWYFRWRTASPPVIARIREAGHSVGLHYETLTRLALERNLQAHQTSDLIPEARELLARELAAFSERFGPARSACPHGDTRVPGVHNGILLRGQDLSSYGIEWDSNDAVGRRGFDVWLSDRSKAEGGWQEYGDPIDLILDRRSPFLLVIHPNNWVSGAGLWWDRLLPGGIRTGSDEPALSPLAVQAGAEPV